MIELVRVIYTVPGFFSCLTAILEGIKESSGVAAVAVMVGWFALTVASFVDRGKGDEELVCRQGAGWCHHN